MKKLVVLSGAGISVESGLATFRGADGLWEGHSIEEVATPQAWHQNPALVLKFYNERRKALKSVQPNEAHHALAGAEQGLDVTIITQNVDDLHERAGSSKVLHLHGELLKARSTANHGDVYDWYDDLSLGDTCHQGHQLRPHIVWFGEAVPMLAAAIEVVRTADVLLVVGTSLLVYPAAGLIHDAPTKCQVIYVDPDPSREIRAMKHIKILANPATIGVIEALQMV